MSDGDRPDESVTIRLAERSDAETIVHFVQELARFEKEPLENVHIDERAVLEHGFGDRPRFEAMIAEDAGNPVGLALFFENYSTWTARPGIWIEELFVEERFRGLGIGRRLVDSVVELAKSRGCGRVELAALDWNPATDFYRSQGFEELDEWRIFRFRLSADG